MAKIFVVPFYGSGGGGGGFTLQIIYPENGLGDTIGFKVSPVSTILLQLVLTGLLGNLNQPILPGDNLIQALSKLQGQINFLTSNEVVGTAVFSGNGATTAFTINHNASFTPIVALVQPASAAAASVNYASGITATSFTVTFLVAPLAGANNIILFWAVR